MNKKWITSLLAMTLAIGLLLAGCGGNTASSGGGEGGGGNNRIVIASQSPLSGPQSAVGDSIKTGAEYALNLRKEEFKQLGFELEFSPQDDQADPKQGVANAEMLIANPDVLGVVAHFNTGVAIPSSVKYEEGKLVMVTPAASGVKLTEEGKRTVHRINARDDKQGPQGALFAAQELGVKSVFLIHDKTAYGQGLVDEVKKKFEELGVQILGYEGITQGEKDYSAVVNKAISTNPDMIYFGGIYPEAGILVKQARDKGYQGYFMGGDGIDSSDFLKIAGPAGEGVYFTSLAGDVRSTEEGRKWAEAYKQATGKEPEAYSVYAFDAMNLILNAVRAAIEENGGKKPTREQVLEKVHATKDFQGQFTRVTFDEKGDNIYADVFIFRYGKEKSEFIGKAE